MLSKEKAERLKATIHKCYVKLVLEDMAEVCIELNRIYEIRCKIFKIKKEVPIKGQLELPFEKQ